MLSRLLAGILVLALVPAAANGWGAHGHRTVTLLALDGLPPDAPAWLRDPAVRSRIAEEANEPDRWRGTRLAALTHENDPDHYIDIDKLPQFGLTLETVPRLRNDYLRELILAKQAHPELVDAYDRAKDADGSSEWPGFVPHAIAEHYAKLRSSFNTLRTLEAIADPARAHQVELARANVVYHMGLLSHFVGDAAQPLHTTKHHHGWVGENPSGYTTDSHFHAYIDTDILHLHALTYDLLRPSVGFTQTVTAADPWPETVRYIERAHGQVEPLYQMEKDGRLKGPEGKQLISDRLCDAAAMLGALYRAAWESSAPTEREILAFKKYNNLEPVAPPRPAAAAPAPAAAPTDAVPAGRTPPGRSRRRRPLR